MKTRTTALRLALLGALVMGCGKLTQSQQEAEKKVREFHALLNDSKFDEIDDGGGAELHKAATRSDFKSLLAAVRRKLGRVVTTVNKGWGVKSFNMTPT